MNPSPRPRPRPRPSPNPLPNPDQGQKRLIKDQEGQAQLKGIPLTDAAAARLLDAMDATPTLATLGLGALRDEARAG